MRTKGAAIDRVMLRQSNDAYEISPIQDRMVFHATIRTGSGVDTHVEQPIDIDKLIEGWRYGRPLLESIVVYEHLTLDVQLNALGGELRRVFT